MNYSCVECIEDMGNMIRSNTGKSSVSTRDPLDTDSANTSLHQVYQHSAFHVHGVLHPKCFKQNVEYICPAAVFISSTFNMGLYSYQVNLTFKMRLYTECQVHLTRAVCYFRHDKYLNMRQYTEYQVNLTFKMRLYFPPRFSKLYIPDPLVLFTLVAYLLSKTQFQPCKIISKKIAHLVPKFSMIRVN